MEVLASKAWTLASRGSANLLRKVYKVAKESYKLAEEACQQS